MLISTPSSLRGVTRGRVTFGTIYVYYMAQGKGKNKREKKRVFNWLIVFGWEELVKWSFRRDFGSENPSE